MEWERQRVYDYEDGKTARMEAGKEAKALKDAIEFLKENIPATTIAKCVKLPLEKILELQKSISATKQLEKYLSLFAEAANTSFKIKKAQDSWNDD